MNKKSSRAKKIAPSHHNCSSSGSPVQPAWTPFEKGVLPPLPEVSVMQEQADSSGVTLEEVISTYESIAREESVLINSRYQVNIRKIGDTMVHLSIKRRDKAPVHDWRDLQRIKNEVVGPEN